MNKQRHSDDLQDHTLLSVPRRPTFLSSSVHAIKNSWILVGSPIAAFVIAIAAWVFPSPKVATVLRQCVWIPIAILAFIFGKYVVDLYIYFSKNEVYLRRLRSTIFALAGIKDPGPSSSLIFRICGIADHSGTVEIVIEEKASKAVQLGTTLVLVATNTKEEWGTVKVIRFDHNLAHAEVIDRTHPEFWESLEDRMKTDTSFPDGFHLEPYGLKKLADLMRG